MNGVQGIQKSELTQEEKQKVLNLIAERIRTLDETIGQLDSRWVTANNHCIIAMAAERGFAKDAAWDASILEIQKQLFLAGDVFLLLAGVGTLLPRLVTAVAARAGMSVVTRTGASVFIKQRSGQWAINATELKKVLKAGESIVWSATAATAVQVAEKFLVESGKNPTFDLVGNRGPESQLVQMADAMLRRMLDAKDEGWKQVQNTASKRWLLGGKEVSAAGYLAYWTWVRQNWYQIQEGIHFLKKDVAEAGISDLRAIRKTIETHRWY